MIRGVSALMVRTFLPISEIGLKGHTGEAVLPALRFLGQVHT
jgi:hypothetical protein